MNIIEKYANKLVPKEQSLHVYWYVKDGLRYYTVVCDCGNNRLLVHENGIRCVQCQEFHSHDAFMRAKEKVNKAKFGTDNKIEQVPQPYIEMWERAKKQRELLKHAQRHPDNPVRLLRP